MCIADDGRDGFPPSGARGGPNTRHGRARENILDARGGDAISRVRNA